MLQVALRDAQATQAELATVKRELMAAQAQLTRVQADYEAAAMGWRVKDQASSIKPASQVSTNCCSGAVSMPHGK